jgi:hypothetical protein
MATQTNTKNNTDTKGATNRRALKIELAKAERLEREATKAFRNHDGADRASYQAAALAAQQAYSNLRAAERWLFNDLA